MTNLNRNEVAIEIEETLNRTNPSERTKWCIYRVPNDLRKLNKDAYTPQVVSIGPFHCDNERLQNMQTHKWEYCKAFVERTRINVDNLVSFVEELEPHVRSCYAENIVFDKNKLVKIISLDACFIIELFVKHNDDHWSRDDALLPGTWLSHAVVADLLLLENQLPLFILENLFNWAFSSCESNSLPSFLELTFNYFRDCNNQTLNSNGVNVCHFIDLLRYLHLQHPSRMRPERTSSLEILNFNATKLHEVGIRFEVNDTSHCLLELQFSRRVLKMPKILVDDATEMLFRNMVAFEQCHYPWKSYIIDYVAILDFLIDTGKDVDVLIQNGIIVSQMDDSDAVARLFNGLNKNVVHWNVNNDYFQLCKNLKKVYRNPCQKLKANLRHDYCRTPWQSAASIAGILLLFLTLIQTISSVIQITQQ